VPWMVWVVFEGCEAAWLLLSNPRAALIALLLDDLNYSKTLDLGMPLRDMIIK
jgi:hypothetical protein